MSVLSRLRSWTGELFYRAARRVRGEDWPHHPATGEHASQSSMDELLLRARDLAANSETAGAMASTLSDLIVGEGILCFNKPFEQDLIELLGDQGVSNDEENQVILAGLAYTLENTLIWDKWSKTADTHGDSTWSEIERLACYELINAGNAYIVRTYHDPDDPDHYLPVSYSLIENDQIDRTNDRLLENGGRILNGIEYDSVGRKVAIWVFDRHPGDHDALAVTSSPIPWSRIIHAYLRLRPTARTGIPWAQSAYQAITNGDLYLGSEIKSAAHQSVVAWTLHSPRHNQFKGFSDGLSNQDTHGNERVKLGQSTIAKLGDDEELKAVETAKSKTNPGPFLAENRIQQGMGAGVSPSRLTRDYRNHSYTSARAAQLDDDSHFRPLQKWFASKITIPIREEVIRIAVALGKFRSIRAEQFFADEDKYQTYDAIGPGREQLNPIPETESSIARMRAGTSTSAIETAKFQRHWFRIYLQLALEQRVRDQLGLQIDYSKGGGQPIEPQGSGDDEQTDSATNGDAVTESLGV